MSNSSRMPLHYQILIALLIGVTVGLIFNFRFSQRTTEVELPDLEMSVEPDPQVFHVLFNGGAGPQRQTLGSFSALEKRYPQLAELYHREYPQGTEPVAATLVVKNRTLKIDEDLDQITLMHSGTLDGAPFTDTINARDPAELVRKFPEWGPAYAAYGGTPSRTLADWAKAIGDLFLRMLKMISIPLIVTSLVTGVTGLGSSRQLGKMFAKTLGYYVTTSLLAITTGICMVNLIRPGVGAILPGEGAGAIEGADQTLTGIFGNLINDMIPPNPIAALTDANFLSIITFSLLIGIFTIRAGEKAGRIFREFFQAAFEVMMGMTQFVIGLAPIGVGAFMIYATASQGLQIFSTLAWYMLTVFLALLVHACVVLPLFVAILGRRSPWKFAQAMSPALMTAFSTASSNGTLPLTLTSVETRAGVPNRVSSFVLPLGATINMDGTALYEAVAVLFIAQATPGFAMSVQAQILVAVTALLASVGAAGIPHAGLVMMAIVLQAVGLPLEAQGVILAVDRVLDMCRTTVNVWSDACGCAVITRLTEGEAG
ncbi:MAG: dicarboxylate/amino acid:cation symporter [Planctomycetaceae bacterium]